MILHLKHQNIAATKDDSSPFKLYFRWPMDTIAKRSRQATHNNVFVVSHADQDPVDILDNNFVVLEMLILWICLNSPEVLQAFSALFPKTPPMPLHRLDEL